MSASSLTPGGRHRAWQPATPAGLVCCDVDGTLVGSDGDVSDAVAAAARDAVDAGLLVGLATGRLWQGVEGVLERTGLPGPHVVCNGGIVMHEGELLASWPVPDATVAALLDACRAHGVYLEVYTPDGYVTSDHDDRADAHTALLGVAPTGVLAPGELPDGPVAKVTALVFDGGDQRPVVELLEAHGLKADAGVSPAVPGMGFVNGTDPSADKGLAMREAAARLGVDVAATVAIGDADNDLAMLDVAGTAVAMGQADDHLCEAAHLVAPSVDDDGVAATLAAAMRGWDGVPRP